MNFINAEGKEYLTKQAIICTQHGLVSLSDENYELQMDNPNQLWYCPICGLQAEWDDDCPETNPAEDDPNGAPPPEGNKAGKDWGKVK